MNIASRLHLNRYCLIRFVHYIINTELSAWHSHDFQCYRVLLRNWKKNGHSIDISIQCFSLVYDTRPRLRMYKYQTEIYKLYNIIYKNVQIFANAFRHIH